MADARLQAAVMAAMEPWRQKVDRHEAFMESQQACMESQQARISALEQQVDVRDARIVSLERQVEEGKAECRRLRQELGQQHAVSGGMRQQMQMLLHDRALLSPLVQQAEVVQIRCLLEEWCKSFWHAAGRRSSPREWPRI
jgi:chromosome segregation ATPase